MRWSPHATVVCVVAIAAWSAGCSGVEVVQRPEPENIALGGAVTFDALPLCKAQKRTLAATPQPSDSAERPPLPNQHPFDGDDQARAAYKALQTATGFQEFGPLMPDTYEYDEVRRLLQPPIELEPLPPLVLGERALAVLGELGYGAHAARSSAEVEAGLLGLLATLVELNSQSRQSEGNQQVRDRLAGRLSAIGFTIESHPEAGVTVARLWPAKPLGERLLLIGHTDTVLPAHSFEPMLCRQDGFLHGSGVADMKGGLVVMVTALEALYRSGHLEDRAITVLINSDEEIGSQASKPLIEEEARRHDFGLSFESGKQTAAAGGGLTLARKGILGINITIWGMSAHSGVAHQEGLDAGRMAARVIDSIGALTDYERGLTANIGIIETNDGAANNRVLARVRLGGEIRYWEPGRREELIAAVQTLVKGAMACNRYLRRNDKVCSAYRAELRGRRPSPLTPERKVRFSQIAAIADALGTPVSPVASGGASDMNAAVGLDMIDSFGPIGYKTHTPDEAIPFASLLQRTRLTALTILATAEVPKTPGN